MEIFGELPSRKIGNVLMLVVEDDEFDFADSVALNAGKRDADDEGHDAKNEGDHYPFSRSAFHELNARTEPPPECGGTAAFGCEQPA